MKQPKTKEAKHNGAISLWKFIFCLVIALYHAKPLFPNGEIPFLKGGYIAVEFFFIVSGFFFAKHVLKEEYNKETIGKESFEFIWKKIKSFLPYLILVIPATAIYKWSTDSSFTTINLINSIWNVLLIKQFGFEGPVITGALWYLSVMLMSMFILYPIVKKYKENFIYIASPILAIFILGFLSHFKVSINNYYVDWVGFVFPGTLRGFAELNIGMFMYLVNQRLKDIDYTVFAKLILTLIPHALLIFVLYIISYINKYDHYDYVMFLMIILATQIMLSRKTYDYKLLSNKFTRFLEKISMPVYINHNFFVIMTKDLKIFAGLTTVPKVLVFLSLSILVSSLEMIIIEFLRKKNYFNINKLFIKKGE